MDQSLQSDLPLAERLRGVRRARSMTQTQLARACRMSDATVSQIETGGRAPSLANLVRLAAALDVSIDYLVGRTDNRVAHLFSGGDLDGIELEPRDQELLRVIARRLARRGRDA